MNCLRRVTLRFVPYSASMSARPISIAPVSPLSIASRQLPHRSFQRRWASDEAPIQSKREEKDTRAAADNEDTQAVESTTKVLKTEFTEQTEPGNNVSIEGIQTADSVLDSVKVNADTPRNGSKESTKPEIEPYPEGWQSPAKFSEPPPCETIYVGNLFFDVTADDLRKQMEKYGIVEQATIVHDTRGLSKGFGYVTFANIQSAKRAVRGMHLSIFEGRRLYVQFAMESLKHTRQKSQPSKLLYIGNLMYEMTDRDLYDLFRDVENVIDIRIAVDRRTGQLRGFAHAEFLDIYSAEVAYEILSRKAPYGRKLHIEYSQKRTKRGGGQIGSSEDMQVL